MTTLESGEFEFIIPCRICGKRDSNFRFCPDYDYISEIILEPDLRKWFEGFVDENIDRLQHEFKTSADLQAAIDASVDINDHRYDQQMYHLDLGMVHISANIKLLDEIKKQYDDGQNKLLLEFYDKMWMLHLILKDSMDHYLKGSDEYSIEQVKMATRMIDIMKRQSMSDGICYSCIDIVEERLKLRPYLCRETYDSMNNMKVLDKEPLGKWERLAQYLPCDGPVLSSTCALLTNQVHIPISESESEYKIGDYVVAIINLTHNFKPTNLVYGIPPIISRVFGHVELCKYGCAHLVLPKEWAGKWISVSRVSDQRMFVRYDDSYDIKDPKSGKWTLFHPIIALSPH